MFPSDILKLNELLATEEESFNPSEQQQPVGSILNPGDVARDGKQKEMAKPYTKFETKINNRNQSDGQKPQTDIWKQEEVPIIPIDKNEKRPAPEFDILYKQKVGTEDIYLGLSDIDQSSVKCQFLLMKIYLPNSSLKEIQLDVTKDIVCVQNPKYFLYNHLPYKVNDKEGKAQWISDKNVLQLTLPIIRDDPF